jgi:uncharacterized membrane protein
VKRYRFLDWMRGVAVLVMIPCHTFNSFARLDLREGGPYVLSQFVGGMAAPLFLFMAGMTLAFQMESAARKEPSVPRRWVGALRRAGYVLAIAYLFRITNWVASLPHAEWAELTKVDILNCMGIAMAAISVAAMFQTRDRIRFAILAGLAIAVAAPPMTYLRWDSVPAPLREYLVFGPGRGRFPFFPCASYVPFGLAAGAILRSTAPERLERLVEWCVLIGTPLIFVAQYFSNLPYSLYSQSDFWRNSPALILIRVGVCLLLLAASYLWTEFGVGTRWSWVECLGRHSLMVYWVHVMLVYGDIVKPLKRALDIPATALATVAVIGLMVGLAAAWEWWKTRRAASPRLRPAAASSHRGV